MSTAVQGVSASSITAAAPSRVSLEDKLENLIKRTESVLNELRSDRIHGNLTSVGPNFTLKFTAAQKLRLDTAIQRNINTAEELTTAVERMLRININDHPIQIPEMLLHRLQTRDHTNDFPAYLQSLVIMLLEQHCNLR